MADKLSVQTIEPAKRRPSRRTIAIVIAAVALIAGGITATSLTAKADADEIARQCKAALKTESSVTGTITPALEIADKALAAVKSVDLPGGESWESTSYADHPGTAALEASPAKDGVAAVAAKPVRHSGAWMTNSVIADRHALANVKAATACTTHEQAANLLSTAKITVDAITALDADTKALLADFSTFQTDEHARVAAEVAAEAARKAAEEAAAAEAARQAATEQAARDAAASRASSGASSSHSSSGSGSSGSGSGSSAHSYPTPPNGGSFRVGTPGPGPVQKQCSNGVGGTMKC